MDNVKFNISAKHEILQEAFRGALMRGEYAPGDRFPSQSELCQKYGVAINTVREAVAGLVSEGLLVRIHGKGTFVAETASHPLTIGIVIDKIGVVDLDQEYLATTNIGAPIMHYLHEEAMLNSAGIYLCLSNESEEAERKNIQSLIERKVDGAVIFYIGEEQNRDVLQELKDSGIPFVLIERYLENLDCDYVVGDNYGATRQAIQCLIDRGFDNILHLCYSCWPSTGSERELGFLDTLKANGLPTENTVFPIMGTGANFNIDDTKRLVREALKHVGDKFALYVTHSGLLNHVWPAVEELGVKHSDVAIACVDEIPAGWLPDDVFHIKIIMPLADMSRECIRIVMDKIRGGTGRRQVVMKPRVEIIDPIQVAKSSEKLVNGEALTIHKV